MNCYCCVHVLLTSCILRVVSFTPDGDEVDADAVNVNAASEEDDVENQSLLDAASRSVSQRSLPS